MKKEYQTPDNDMARALLLHNFIAIRHLHGDPDKRAILKSIARTSTRHVVPEGWRWM